MEPPNTASDLFNRVLTVMDAGKENTLQWNTIRRKFRSKCKLRFFSTILSLFDLSSFDPSWSDMFVKTHNQAWSHCSIFNHIMCPASEGNLPQMVWTLSSNIHIYNWWQMTSKHYYTIHTLSFYTRWTPSILCVFVPHNKDASSTGENKPKETRTEVTAVYQNETSLLHFNWHQLNVMTPLGLIHTASMFHHFF